MTQVLSIKDTRNNLADIVSRVEMTGDEVIITKFGKPRAMFVPLPDKKSAKANLDEVFGIWRGRTDIKDSGKWVRNLREKISLRQKI